MRADFYPSDEYETEEFGEGSAVVICSPRQVLLDRTLSTDQKRALLASWASDLRAVENHPALRRLDDGTVLYIDDILEALKALDLPPDTQDNRSNILTFPGAHIGRSDGGKGSGDDDPPPGPLAMELPKPRNFIDAFAPSGLSNSRRSPAVVA
ncbi:MAG: hypothetical protein WBA73_18170 [Devosia sp.]